MALFFRFHPLRLSFQITNFIHEENYFDHPGRMGNWQ